MKPGAVALRAYERGREVERREMAEWLDEFAEDLADFVVLGYLDGRDHASPSLNELVDDPEAIEQRAASARELHERAARAFRTAASTWFAGRAL